MKKTDDNSPKDSDTTSDENDDRVAGSSNAAHAIAAPVIAAPAIVAPAIAAVTAASAMDGIAANANHHALKKAVFCDTPRAPKSPFSAPLLQIHQMPLVLTEFDFVNTRQQNPIKMSPRSILCRHQSVTSVPMAEADGNLADVLTST
jgi:hypothetical protein